jgi:tetratricopeptide (TPR) repeat protein
MTPRRFATNWTAFALLIALPAVARGADELDAAKDLYAAAAYDEALTALDRVRMTGPGAASSVYLVQQYRALCLIALGRSDEAKKTVEDMVRSAPGRRAAKGELPPRLEALFHEARQRVLPVAAQEAYARGKAGYDARDYAAAALAFERAVTLLADPDVSPSPQLGDLRTLATGFLQLSRAGLSAKAIPPPSEAPAASAETAPVTLVQTFPSWPSSLMAPKAPLSGLIEVAIDATGKVAALKFVRRMNPIYDQMVETASKEWRYTPATRNGKPVAGSKTIVVNVGKQVTSEADH